jgi:hypothetical protein
MKFEEKPDYNYLRSLFKSMMSRYNFEYDGQFDWILKKEGKQSELKSMMAQMDTKAALPRTISQPAH